ncbi:hypothetical protein GOEFS_094_00550 [Gordonia effusa NBRC 100432]|uniref:Uncharacterized protein n=1 Tax=Gordonia effusa NBRC 100432 TaxID=1077974 RepID=H0R3V5_9ACTN|nr:hypothetical protein [Gordonia effusa]GAB19756.1 hypothetical protein GOEFS_094_00550 [Gordonia effusa NBRC 100432]
MNVEGCWSTVICNASERAAVGYLGRDWALQCRLSSGHDGNHATDGDSGAAPSRRRWLEWTDFSEYPHSLLERDPCPVYGRTGAACELFSGHGGLHFYAPAPSRTADQQSEPASQPPAMPSTPATTTVPRSPDYRGGHRMTDTSQPQPARVQTPELNGVELRRADTFDRIDATIRESMELLASERRAVIPDASTEVDSAGAALISDALTDVAAAFERLAQAYRSVGR